MWACTTHILNSLSFARWLLSGSLACSIRILLAKSICQKRADTQRESEKMATVVGSSFRCRTKLLNLTQFGRCYSTTNTINRTIKQNSKLIYIIGGGLVAFSYAKWTKSQTVYAAFNPKKIKVSPQMYITIVQRYHYKYVDEFVSVLLSSRACVCVCVESSWSKYECTSDRHIITVSYTHRSYSNP